MQVEIVLRNESSYQFCTCQFYGYNRNSIVKPPVKLVGGVKSANFHIVALKLSPTGFPYP